jgi:hypothetical protein
VITKPTSLCQVLGVSPGGYYPHRRHQSLGQKSPINFERSHQPRLVAESP